MELTVTTPQPINVVTFLRQVGFHPIHDYNDAKDSWVRLLGRGHYPRFHLYVTNQGKQYTFSLHLDQTQHTMAIKGLRRHAGEYDSLVVEQEMGRIKRWVNYLIGGG